MYHFFLCVCVCVLVCVCVDMNVEQKCSYGTGSVWNPLSPTSHRHRGGKTMEFLVFPKWQHGMEIGRHVEFNWYVTHTHTHTNACMKCLVCVNVPSECGRCQALMTGAPETLCVCVCVCAR